MTRFTPIASASGALAAALALALAFESVYDLSFAPRPADPLAAGGHGPRPAFTLRMVDSGGVGIPLAGWGADYSHDRRVFREVILEDPPYVQAEAFARVADDWRAYVERMAAYGNNAMAVPMLLELIDFDRLAADAHPAAVVYAAGSPYRARHAALRRHFGPLFEWTARRGVQVFLETDLPVVTPPLAAVLAPRGGGIDASDPAVWRVYRAGLEELFDAFPSIAGLVVRFGEGGGLYNTPGWPYRSEVAIRSAADLRSMLRGLLPAFEARGRTLVLRSWTVGVGPLGRLHVDPRQYERVLGEIDSPALVVSTKVTAGDFFSYLPLNPTLAAGRHRRIVELQAKPEFEGFGAFPNFLGAEHARALGALAAANPRLEGTYLLTQAGGPLRAGPRTLYPLHGFWLWTDANVFAASRAAADPEAGADWLAREWARATFADARVADAVAAALADTRQAVLDGFYIRPFAEQDVRVPGLDLPPLMWIFEWDMLGGWHSLLSLVYRGSRAHVDRAIREGDAAAAAVARARQRLADAFAAAGPDACGALCADALRSLEYQQTLFETLAAWRQACLSLYQALDTGDAQARAGWRAGRDRFRAAAHDHGARFGADARFPAFDLTSAHAAVAMAEREPLSRAAAAGSILLVLLLTGRSRLFRLASAAPWRLPGAPIGAGQALAIAAVPLALLALLVVTLTGAATPRPAASAVLVAATVACAFAVAGGRGGPAAGRLATSLAPATPGLLVLLGAIAWFGPLGVWYRWWTLPAFRVFVLTTTAATAAWTCLVMVQARRGEGRLARLGALLAAAGAGLLALAVIAPDWPDALRALDRPLNIAPATSTIVFALGTYAGVAFDLTRALALTGSAAIALGVAIALVSRTDD